MGWALIVAIVVFWATKHWLLRIGAITSLVLQSVAVVATANHYIFDGVVGVAVCLVGLAIAVGLERAGYPGIRRWLGSRVANAHPEAVAS